MMGVDKGLILPTFHPLLAFNKSKMKPVGTITLPVYVAKTVVMITFMVVNTSSSINVIIGRHWIHTIKGVVSTLYQVMRYQSPNRMYTIDIKED